MLLFLLLELSVPVSYARLPYIVGGRDVPYPGKWPWQASLERNGGHNCGASLVGSRWLVTAAHCVTSSPSAYTVTLGMHDRSTQRQGSPTMYSLSRVIRHPNYNGNAAGFPNDIAMLYLSSSANTNSQYIRTIALPSRNENFARNSNCYITGWGATRGGGSLPNILQETHADVYTVSWCRNNFSSSVRDCHVCTGKKNKSTSCQGDSGGPLACRVGSTWKLVGASSWARYGCPPSQPGVYARVPYFRDWIHSVSGL